MLLESHEVMESYRIELKTASHKCTGCRLQQQKSFCYAVGLCGWFWSGNHVTFKDVTQIELDAGVRRI